MYTIREIDCGGNGLFSRDEKMRCVATSRTGSVVIVDLSYR